MKKIITACLALLCAAQYSATAQTTVETTVEADIVNQYIWRGQELGGVSLQPTLGVAHKGLSLTAWGNVGLVDASDTKEFDLTLAYELGKWNVGVTDYWFNTPNDRYFCYDTHKTSHVFEANLGYNFGPCSLQWFTIFAGNDGANSDGDRAYSSYVELSAPFTFGGCEWTATVGAVPYATTLYAEANGFAVTNLSLTATKDLRISDTFSVPVFGGIATNPSARKAYLVFGFTLRP